jgi:myo-inositol 2-dehydrogenase/D-chiro-inositol 1-dehydrogenase
MGTSGPGRKSSRRQFLTSTMLGSAGALAGPLIIPSLYRAGAQTPPNRRIQIAQIGCGRMGMGDVRGTMAHGLCRIVAVCDLDTKRLANAKAVVERHYHGLGETSVNVAAYRDYREVLARPDIDAVIVTTPDHWHALVAVQAALAGKDLHVQKPLTYDIAEAMALRTVVRAKQRVLQTGSQQRSSKPWTTFRAATEAVRNGRIGTVTTVRIGIGRDEPKGVVPAPQLIPPNLDYDTWLGPAPQQPYMEDRVHPQTGLGRPGWITTEDFGLGMITNWGAHHIDICHWGLGLELGGPTRIEARADFMKNDVWTVHHSYHVEMAYPGGIQVVLDDTYPNGLRFEGTEGWVFCARGAGQVTSSDPGTPPKPGQEPVSLAASNPSILSSPLGPDAVRWPDSEDHYLNWLQAIERRRDPIAPVDQSARSLEACAAAWIAMKLGRPVTWDPKHERFVDDDEANAMCGRNPRSAAYNISAIMKTPDWSPGSSDPGSVI